MRLDGISCCSVQIDASLQSTPSPTVHRYPSWVGFSQRCLYSTAVANLLYKIHKRKAHTLTTHTQKHAHTAPHSCDFYKTPLPHPTPPILATPTWAQYIMGNFHGIIYMCVCVCVCEHAFVCVCGECVCFAFVYFIKYIYVCVCVCGTHTEKHAHTHTYTHTHTLTL